MEARVRLALLLAVAAVSISASLQSPPEGAQGPPALVDAIAARTRTPDEVSHLTLGEPAMENRQVPKRMSRSSRQCIIVNNQRRCRPIRPGYGSPVGRPGKKEMGIYITDPPKIDFIEKAPTDV